MTTTDFRSSDSPVSHSPPSDAPLPGTIGLTSISGEVGRLIRLGQWLAETPLSRWFSKDTEPPYQHAFLYLGDGKILEAEPGGARIADVTEYSVIYWCTGIASRFTAEQLDNVARSAPDFVNVPYSFLDYFALAARRLRVFPLYPILRVYVRSTRHKICSALADAMYQANGLQVFRDRRWDGDVMPMDLFLEDVAAQMRKAVSEVLGLWG